MELLVPNEKTKTKIENDSMFDIRKVKTASIEFELKDEGDYSS